MCCVKDKKSSSYETKAPLELTTLWRYTDTFIIIIVIVHTTLSKFIALLTANVKF